MNIETDDKRFPSDIWRASDNFIFKMNRKKLLKCPSYKQEFKLIFKRPGDRVQTMEVTQYFLRRSENAHSVQELRPTLRYNAKSIEDGS